MIPRQAFYTATLVDIKNLGLLLLLCLASFGVVRYLVVFECVILEASRRNQKWRKVNSIPTALDLLVTKIMEHDFA
jgi:hypothetical protein